MLKGVFSHPYVKFVAKRVAFYGLVVFVALTLAFFIPRFMPGSPIQNWIRGMPTGGTSVNYTAIKIAIEEYYGLNKPLQEQYVNFWRNLLHWPPNLGISYRFQQRPVVAVVLERLPHTLVLVVPILIISFFLGNWIGAKAAYMGGKPSELVYFLSVFSNRLPSFWLGIILTFVLSTWLGLLPPVGGAAIPLIQTTATLESISNFFRHFTLPFLTLFIIYLGGWATGMRSMVIPEMDSGYVRYSDQLGFRKSKSMAYAKRNAMLPQFTGLNLYFNALIGETTVIEYLFGWPGVGRLLYEGAYFCDYNVIIGTFIVILIIVTLGNFIIDILYGIMDPRIRIGGKL
jgi:peptide/nickel transport system permease protein